jgi:hypothetical protein
MKRKHQDSSRERDDAMVAAVGIMRECAMLAQQVRTNAWKRAGPPSSEYLDCWEDLLTELNAIQVTVGSLK